MKRLTLGSSLVAALLLVSSVATADDPIESVRFSATTVLAGNPLVFAAPVDLR